MHEPVVRETLLKQTLHHFVTSTVEVRRITMQPNVAGGPHHHNGPVFGVIENGSAVFQVDGGEERVLRPGDAFYEPAEVLIDRFDATEEGATFIAYFPNGPGQEPQLIAGPPAS